jgi:quinol monooxygenase YgiN
MTNRALFALAFDLPCICLMISMNLRIVPQPRRTAELIHALRLQMSRTESQPGCLQCRLSQDQEQPNIVFYQEDWDDWSEIEKHIRSDRFIRILELMELSTVTPVLSFCDIHETRGMEYVQKLRTATAD